MRNRWDRKKSVLYHAVSSYQLLEVMLHRMVFHPTEKAELLLPDFIIQKYPQYQDLEDVFFDRVELFPYLSIPHIRRKQILKDTCRYAERILSEKLSSYSAVYVAGAHFYFSLYLIQKKKPFVFFEDAAGMLTRPNVLYEAIEAKYPLQGKIAAQYGLLDGSNPLIWKIICLKKSQSMELREEKYQEFFRGGGFRTPPSTQKGKGNPFFSASEDTWRRGCGFADPAVFQPGTAVAGTAIEAVPAA